MLPLELLKVIFGALSRDDLDALMLTNVLFYDIVIREFAKEPLRYFESLNILGVQSYSFDLATGDKHHCSDNDDFRRRMRLARVGRLGLPITVSDDNILDALLPVRDAWRDGDVDMWNFASVSQLERACSELLFCKRMFVMTALDGPLSQRFASLPAVRECTSLHTFRYPSPLTVAEVGDWLRVDSHSKEPKRLLMGHIVDAQSVENLIQQLKTPDIIHVNYPRDRLQVQVDIGGLGVDRHPARYLMGTPRNLWMVQKAGFKL